MSLYKDASLVMIPTAYKDGKLYSVRPVEQLGSELVTNGDFSSASDWTFSGSGVAISGGKLNFTGTTREATQSISVVNTKTYRVSYEVSNFSAGSVRAEIGSSAGIIRTANGIYSEYIVASGANTIEIDAVSVFTGSIDNVSVKEVLVANGDFTFSRGSDISATRVNSSGLIEKAKVNLLTYSNDFSNAAWVKLGAGTGTAASVTSGFTDPNGGSNAWRLQCDLNGGTTTSDQSLIYQSGSGTGVFAFSYYVKSNTGASQNFAFGNDLNGYEQSVATTSWQRFDFFKNTSATRNTFIGTRGTTGSDDTLDILIYAAQLNHGLIAQDYVETTTTAVVEGLTADLPRLDYSGGASCPSLLLEPQRTNLIPQSEYFGGYTLVNVTANANNATSPEGVQNAYKIVEDSANTNKHFRAANTTLTASTYAVSAFIKPNNCDVISLREGAVSGDAFTYKFSTGGSSIQGSRWDGATIEAEDYGNGWYRISANFTATTGASYNFRIHLLGNDFNQTTNPSVGTYTYTGDGASGIWVYGFQAELGSYPTSYIPCMGTSQTRSVDGSSLTGVSDILGQTQGTIFIEVGEVHNNSVTGPTKWFMEIRKDQNNSFGFGSGGADSAPNIRFVTNIAGSVSTDAEPAGFSNSKIAIRYTAEDFKIYQNGVLQSTIAKSIGGYVDIQFMEGAGDDLSMPIKQFSAFPTALTDSECIALTTL